MRADAKAKSLDDLKGAKMGWVARGSASGRAFPRAYLSRRGIDPASYFGRNLDFADHEAVCRAGQEGQVDAGATFSDERPAGQAALHVVVYCNGGHCDDSERAAIFLRDLGIPKDRLYVYGGGISEWRHHWPVETGEQHSGKLLNPKP